MAYFARMPYRFEENNTKIYIADTMFRPLFQEISLKNKPLAKHYYREDSACSSQHFNVL